MCENLKGVIVIDLAPGAAYLTPADRQHVKEAIDKYNSDNFYLTMTWVDVIIISLISAGF